MAFPPAARTRTRLAVNGAPAPAMRIGAIGAAAGTESSGCVRRLYEAGRREGPVAAPCEQRCAIAIAPARLRPATAW